MFGTVVGVIVCLAIAQPNATQTRTTSNTKTENGRWQIVNGTPGLSRNIMLLDTQTGDSWITCEDSAKSTHWCWIPKSYSASSGVKPPDGICLEYDEKGACLEQRPAPLPPKP
jgi:hypothetical protein